MAREAFHRSSMRLPGEACQRGEGRPPRLRRRSGSFGESDAGGPLEKAKRNLAVPRFRATPVWRKLLNGASERVSPAISSRSAGGSDDCWAGNFGIETCGIERGQDGEGRARVDCLSARCAELLPRRREAASVKRQVFPPRISPFALRLDGALLQLMAPSWRSTRACRARLIGACK